VHLFDPQLTMSCLNKNSQCVFAALVAASFCWFDSFVVMTKEGAMKALALLTAAALSLLSVAASAQTYGTPYGKGKAPPPPPVVTKG
jgi:hypothetical protein